MPAAFLAFVTTMVVAALALLFTLMILMMGALPRQRGGGAQRQNHWYDIRRLLEEITSRSVFQPVHV